MYAIDHIGVAVKNIDEALAQYQNIFGYSLNHREKLEESGVEIAFLKTPNTLIEFVAPLNDNNPISKFLEQRGPGLHHICYVVDDIVAELERFAELGHELIDKTPRRGAHNSLIAFIYPKGFSGVLTELCEFAE